MKFTLKSETYDYNINFTIEASNIKHAVFITRKIIRKKTNDFKYMTIHDYRNNGNSEEETYFFACILNDGEAYLGDAEFGKENKRVWIEKED